MDWMFGISDLAIVFATLLGPVLAVQAQKWIERSREKRARQVSVFRTLMATRIAILSPTHVEALNLVPIEFFGHSEIVTAWKTYLDHLNAPFPAHLASQSAAEAWLNDRVRLLNDLLFKVSKHLGYGFTELEIKREAYSPSGHAKIESEQEIIRRGLVALFEGKAALPMEVKLGDAESLAEQTELRRLLLDWLKGKLSVKIVQG